MEQETKKNGAAPFQKDQQVLHLLYKEKGKVKAVFVHKKGMVSPYGAQPPKVTYSYAIELDSGKEVSADQDELLTVYSLATRQIEETEAQADEPGNTLDLLSSDGWFKRHPEKVLGKPYQSTDRFNKPVTKIKGSISDVIQGINVPSSIPEEQPAGPLETELKPPLDWLGLDPVKKANIEKVIGQATKANKEKAFQILYGDEKQKAEANCPTGQLCFKDILEQYNKGITKEEIQAWIWHKRKSQGLNDETVILSKKNGWSEYVVPLAEAHKHVERWMRSGVVCYYKEDFIPSVLYYAENIYERETTLLREKDRIIELYGQDQFDQQLRGLHSVKPSKLTLADPVPENRLVIRPDSKFTTEVEIRDLADGTSFKGFSRATSQFEHGASVTLQDGFKQWLQQIPGDEFKKSTRWDIVAYYLDGRSPGRSYDKEEKLRLRQNAKQEGDRLFSRFLAEALTRDDQLRIEQLWNSRYNGYVEINYFKIPVAFTCSSTFKNKPLFIRPAQREGIGFISVHGSGCVAYDVGLGKTMTAILAIAQAIEMGQCKRPFIIVPNQTYKNWLTEIGGTKEKGKTILTGLLPQYPINDLYNLGTDYIDQLRDEDGNIKPVPEGSITVMTYEGFNRLGFNEGTWTRIGDELFDILNQGTEKGREQQILMGKIEEMMGKGLRGGMVNIEDLGLDYMVVDEAHAMKKSFTQVKGEESEGKRAKGKYQIHSGTPSMTALRGFMISQYILRHNHMRNVMLLTATPFTNSPLEIYSILALIGYQELEKWGIKNLQEFFDLFIHTSLELVINSKLKPERKEIVLGFNNLIALQQLIFKFITYKTGEEAGIQRPNKIVLPLLNKREGEDIAPLPASEQISTNLPLTIQQKEFMQDVELYVTGKHSLSHFCVNDAGMEEDGQDENDGTGVQLDEAQMDDDEAQSTRILRGLSFARQIALSPYLYACNPDKKPTWQTYIETSPKLAYVMECIRSVKLFHEGRNEDVSGQVIYMNAGVNYFPLIAEYLVKKIGFKESEVGVIRSGISAAKKEGIKERFLAGSIKVLIGSATIKEGINLQNRATVLYNCWLDWNPTDIKQLEGRIWRFGNRYANVRIVNPLMEDSIDSFIFQKLQEKTSRINEIWYRAGKTNAMSLEEFNPAELKMGLITDPFALAELLLMQQREQVQDEITSLENQKSLLKDIRENRDEFSGGIEKLTSKANSYKPPKTGEGRRSTETILRIFREYLEDKDVQANYSDEFLFDKVRKAHAFLKRATEQVLTPRGLDLNFDYPSLVAKFDLEIEQKKEYLERELGDEAVKTKAEEITSQRQKEGYARKSTQERVKEFTRLNERVLTELMVYGGDSEEKQQQEAHQQKGQALEGSVDRLQRIRELREVIVAITKRLQRVRELKNAS